MDKVVINLTAGAEDSEAALIAYLVGTAAQAAGKEVIVFMTKEAVRLGVAGGPESVPHQEGRPTLSELASQFADGGGRALLCPVCFKSRGLDEAGLLPNAMVAGAAALWEWVGEGATVFTY